MRSKFLAIFFAVFAGFAVTGVDAQTGQPQADFLFIGSYHMSNPGRDVHNIKADDVLAAKRQGEISEVVRMLGRYRPTKVMVEVETPEQEKIGKNYLESCAGSRPLASNKAEQLGFRIACELGLKTVHAVNWNGLGPIKDEDSINYLKAVERHGQQKQYDEHLAIGTAQNDRNQYVLTHGTVLDMLKHLNSDQWLKQNAMAYYRIGMLGTQSDPIGAHWVQNWFGRNLIIFNNIARLTTEGDRVLVIYGAGHGNYLRQLAADSGIYRTHEAMRWLSQQ